jgi:hypothetical protein
MAVFDFNFTVILREHTFANEGPVQLPVPKKTLRNGSAIIVIPPDFILMMDDDYEDDEEIPSITRSPTEAYMEEGSSTSAHSRRNEDIALDLMKFVAMTTGYGRTTSSGVGFQGTGAASKPEEYATHLLELYGKCVAAVAGKK